MTSLTRYQARFQWVENWRGSKTVSVTILHRVVLQIPICLSCNVWHPLFCPVNCPRVAQIQLNETVILYLFNFIGKLRKRRKFFPNVDSYELLRNFHFANCVDPAHAWLCFGEVGLWRMRGPTHGRITTRIWVTATGRITTSLKHTQTVAYQVKK